MRIRLPLNLSVLFSLEVKENKIREETSHETPKSNGKSNSRRLMGLLFLGLRPKTGKEV